MLFSVAKIRSQQSSFQTNIINPIEDGAGTNIPSFAPGGQTSPIPELEDGESAAKQHLKKLRSDMVKQELPVPPVLPRSPDMRLLASAFSDIETKTSIVKSNGTSTVKMAHQATSQKSESYHQGLIV